jgi:hypothetical protein
MGRTLKSIAAVLTLAGTIVLVLAGTASASFHDIRIRAVFLGGANNGSVELQMTSDGQNLTNGQTLRLYPNAGMLFSSFVLPNVANGGNQRTILISDNASLNPDVNTGGALHTALMTTPAALCYSTFDCVAWGAFTNTGVLPSPVGAPIGGLSASQVAIRKITPGCETLLENTDDTNNTLEDFSYGIGFPFRNNAGTPTEMPCPKTTTATNEGKKKKCKKKKRKKNRGASAAKKKKRCGKKKRSVRRKR